MTGRVLSIQRMSTEDGPGIRTTIFLKGCPLRCAWCHNPESIRPTPELVLVGDRCMGCGSCREVCPQGLDPDRCTACGHCAEACPTGAREVLGTDWTAEDLAREAARDRAFFETSGGGVTISGGEPALQAPFARAVAMALAAAGIPTAVDTCGAVGEEALWAVVEPSALVLYDLKVLDASAHRHWTGADNVPVIRNLRRLAAWQREGRWNGSLWVRTPLIPGATDDETNLLGIGHLLADLGDAVARWDLCPFNPLCRDQYRRLGRPWPFEGTSFQDPDRLAALAAVARTSGVRPEIVHLAGQGGRGT
ncbi:MAG TPA: glycyl-radical enzyme activating protein [Myxococcota bacterium]|nr:glycyl-radical enzyme activating protein [Myxococcota bacterium]HQK50881.1 glycyl-radical enzyme activating protein [Myxococcota bacterium]